MKRSGPILAMLFACLFPTPIRPQTPPVVGSGALTIEAATELFLKRNLSLEAARLEIDVARSEQIAARLRPRPGLTVSAENLQFSGPTPFNRIYEAGVTVAQPFELGGQRRLRAEVAERSINVAEAQLANVLRQRLFELKRTYFEVVLAKALLAIEEENRDNFAELVRFNTVRFQEGYLAEGELIKVRLERIKFDSSRANAALGLRQAKIRLLELLGESDFGRVETLELREALTFTDISLDLAGLRVQALTNRTDLKVFLAESARAEAAARLERARGKGELVPYAGYKRVGVDNTAVAGITIPLPFGDRNQGGIARADAERQIAETNVRVAGIRAQAEIESAFRAYETAREQVRAYEAGILRQADESRDISLFSYREGSAELFTLLDAQRTRTELRANYYKSLLAYHTAIFQLELATGTDITK